MPFIPTSETPFNPVLSAFGFTTEKQVTQFKEFLKSTKSFVTGEAAYLWALTQQDSFDTLSFNRTSNSNGALTMLIWSELDIDDKKQMENASHFREVTLTKLLSETTHRYYQVPRCKWVQWNVKSIDGVFPIERPDVTIFNSYMFQFHNLAGGPSSSILFITVVKKTPTIDLMKFIATEYALLDIYQFVVTDELTTATHLVYSPAKVRYILDAKEFRPLYFPQIRPRDPYHSAISGMMCSMKGLISRYYKNGYSILKPDGITKETLEDALVAYEEQCRRS